MRWRNAGIAYGMLAGMVGIAGCTSPYVSANPGPLEPPEVKIETPWWDGNEVSAEELLAQLDRGATDQPSTSKAPEVVPQRKTGNHTASTEPPKQADARTPDPKPVATSVAFRTPQPKAHAAPSNAHIAAESIEQVQLRGVATNAQGEAIAMLAGQDNHTHTVRVGDTMTLSRSGHTTNWSIREISAGRVVATDGQQTVVIQ